MHHHLLMVCDSLHQRRQLKEQPFLMRNNLVQHLLNYLVMD